MTVTHRRTQRESAIWCFLFCCWLGTAAAATIICIMKCAPAFVRAINMRQQSALMLKLALIALAFFIALGGLEVSWARLDGPWSRRANVWRNRETGEISKALLRRCRLVRCHRRRKQARYAPSASCRPCAPISAASYFCIGARTMPTPSPLVMK